MSISEIDYADILVSACGSSMKINVLYYLELIKHPDRIVKFISGFRSAGGYCTVCGKPTFFFTIRGALRGNYLCVNCHSRSRNRHLAKVLCDIFAIGKPYSLGNLTKSLPDLNVYEAQAGGVIHAKLKSLYNYKCSEFFKDIPPGSFSSNGILCQDLQNLSFSDNSFDLVITQEVFEHVRNPEIAWREIHRVLKPGGYHVFTIPCSSDHKTVRRVRLEGENVVYILPKVYHGDDIRDGLVYSDFGDDLPGELDAMGFPTQVYYNNDQESKLYRIYESCVFVSRKM
jgi:SAM-dependent methyltransferase